MDAINVARKQFTEHQWHRICDRISDGKEQMIFGYAYDDGTDFVATKMQAARLCMYGLD